MYKNWEGVLLEEGGVSRAVPFAYVPLTMIRFDVCTGNVWWCLGDMWFM